MTIDTRDQPVTDPAVPVDPAKTDDFATKADVSAVVDALAVVSDDADQKIDALRADVTQQINDTARVLMEASTAIQVDIRQAYKELFHDLIIEFVRAKSADPVGDARKLADSAYPPPKG